MDQRLLKKVTREFNKYRAPECQARTILNKDNYLIIQFEGTVAGFACCFDENFVDYSYYLKDLTEEEFVISEIKRMRKEKFIVVYRKKDKPFNYRTTKQSRPE